MQEPASEKLTTEQGTRSSPTRKPTASKFEFMVVSNRLPVDRCNDDGDGGGGWRRSPGGLVTALAPMMTKSDGAWVGWHGAPDETVRPFSHEGMDLVPVQLSSHEVELYYEGFSNATIWPLYHDVIAPPEFHRTWWDSYRAVNKKFADAVIRHAADGATVWVQDYQLQLVPRLLREVRPDLKIGFFNHIPFPPRRSSRSSRGAVTSSTACSAPTSWDSSGPAMPATSCARHAGSWVPALSSSRSM